MEQQASNYLEPAARSIIPSNNIQRGHQETAATGSPCPPEWAAIIREGYTWKRLIERNVRTDFAWAEIVERQGWGRFLFRPASGPDETFYKKLYCKIVASVKDLGGSQTSEPISLAGSLAGSCHGDQVAAAAAGSVRCLQYDDTKMVVGFGDSAIRIWDRARQKWTTTFRALSCSINCLQYNNDFIIGGCSDSIIRVWDLRRSSHRQRQQQHLQTELPVRKLAEHSGSVLNLKFENTMLVSCSADKTVVVWTFQGPRHVHALASLVGHAAEVHEVAFDEHHIVSLSLDGSVKIWHRTIHSCLRTLALDFGAGTAIECLQLRDGLVACGAGRSLQIWDIRSGGCVRKLAAGHEVTFEVKQTVSRQYSGRIRVWPSEPAAESTGLQAASSSSSLSSPSEELPAESDPTRAQIVDLTLGEFQLVRCAWDVMMMRQILTSNRVHQLDLVAISCRPEAAAAAEASKLCRLEQTDLLSTLCKRGVYQLAEQILLSLDAASFCRASRVCRSWLAIIRQGNLWKRMIDRQLNSSQVWLEVLMRRGLVGAGQPARPRSLQVAGPADAAMHERVLVHTSADIEELGERWRLGRPASVERIETDVFGRWSWADDSIQAAQRDASSISLRDRESKRTRTLRGLEGRALCLQASRRMVACGTADGSVLIWRPDSDQPARVLVGHHAPVRCLRFTDRLLVSGSEDMTLIVWQIESLADIRMREILFDHLDEVRALDLDADDRRMASGSLDGNVRVWLLGSLECVNSFETGAGPVQCLQCERALLVAAFERSIRIWDLDSGNQLRALDSIGPIERLRFDTKRIVVGTDQGSIAIWPIEAILDGRLADREIQRANLNERRAFGMLNLQLNQTQIRCHTMTGVTVIWDFLNQGI